MQKAERSRWLTWGAATVIDLINDAFSGCDISSTELV